MSVPAVAKPLVSHDFCDLCYPNDAAPSYYYCGATEKDPLHICPADLSCGCVPCPDCIAVDACPYCGSDGR